MKTMKLGQTNLAVPVFAIGVMHINRLDGAQAEAFVQTCLENGCNFFDNADVYGSDKAQFGRCEEIFSKAVHMSPSVREKIIVQDKIGFEPPRPGECRSERLNSSKAYILQAVDNSLKRLNTDYLDVLLLHAPDALTDPAEVAEAFDALHTNGKVRHFGVSNYNTFQIQLLQKYLKQPIVADQLCLSIANSGLISEGMYVNIASTERSIERSTSVLNYCRLNNITVQCWSPLKYGDQEGTFLSHPAFPELNATLDKIAAAHRVPSSAIAMALPVVGCLARKPYSVMHSSHWIQREMAIAYCSRICAGISCAQFRSASHFHVSP